LVPADYVPEPELRLDLYARLSRLPDPEEIAELAEEIADRFGPLPEAVAPLLELAELRARCRRLGIVRLEVGPKAAAATLRDPQAVGERAGDGLTRSGDRLVLAGGAESPAERLGRAAALLDRIDAGSNLRP
jgi:transcription-repair coupling factor (superfamily II helicase)